MKLDAYRVSVARELIASGWTVAQCARYFGVSWTTMRRRLR